MIDIPDRIDVGLPGPPGAQGTPGVTSVSVNMLPNGDAPTATLTGTALALGIPEGKGEKGDTGERGPAGVTSATATQLPSGDQPTISVTNGVLALGIPAGEKGDAGQGYLLQGVRDSVSKLPADGNTNDAWLVNGHFYVWNPTQSAWQDGGLLQGPSGRAVMVYTGVASANGVITSPESKGLKNVKADDSIIDQNGDLYYVTSVDSSGAHLGAKAGSLKGPKGDPGATGPAGVTSAQVTQLAAGAKPTISLTNGVLTIGIPQGAKGDKGDAGIATVKVTKLAAGSNPTATMNGTTLTLGIPQGDKGDPGVTTASVVKLDQNATPTVTLRDGNLEFGIPSGTIDTSNFVTNDTLSSYVTNDSLNNTLTGYVKKSDTSTGVVAYSSSFSGSLSSGATIGHISLTPAGTYLLIWDLRVGGLAGGGLSSNAYLTTNASSTKYYCSIAVGGNNTYDGSAQVCHGTYVYRAASSGTPVIFTWHCDNNDSGSITSGTIWAIRLG